MTQDEAKKLVTKHGGMRKAAAAIGMAESTFRDRVHGRIKKGRGTKVAKSACCTTSASIKNKKSLADFRRTYDKSYIVPNKVRAGLAALGSSWEYEVEFAKSIAVSLGDLGMFREPFADHIVQVKEGRRIWAGTKALARQMREMI